jgi:hypothetical protein
MDQDLKVPIVQRQNYEHVLEHAHDLIGLGIVEHQVRMDPRLSRDDKALLLSAVTFRFMGLMTKNSSLSLLEI